MSVSRLSFWQQNRNWQIQQQQWTNQFTATAAVGSVLSSALTSQSSGLAAISNHKALLRVTNQLKAAATSVANGLTPAQLAQLKIASGKLQSTQSSSSSSASSLNLLA